MKEKLTQARIDELRKTVPHACLADIASPKEGCDAGFIEKIELYLRHFAKPHAEDGEPCVGCGEKMLGSLADQLFGTGGFTWGLVHGHGNCKNCGWPATMYHFIKDEDGTELLTMRNVLLQAHPDDISLNGV
jgi:hypothetical protein